MAHHHHHRKHHHHHHAKQVACKKDGSAPKGARKVRRGKRHICVR